MVEAVTLALHVIYTVRLVMMQVTTFTQCANHVKQDTHLNKQISFVEKSVAQVSTTFLVQIVVQPATTLVKHAIDQDQTTV